MVNLPRYSLLRYIVAVLAVGLALLVTHQVDLLGHRAPFALFFVAVVFSTWYGGRNPGLLAIGLSALLSTYFILHPLSPLLGHENILRVSTFILLTLLVTLLTSARQNSEQSLRQSEKRYRLLFDSNPLPMWVYDLATLRFLAVNKAATLCYGYSQKEFLSMTIKDIRPAEDVPALLAAVKNLSGELDDAGMWRHRKKDGTIIDVEITTHGIIFDDRRAEIVLANDVTERKRNEEMVIRLAGIVESSDDAIFSKTLDGVITSWNKGAERLYGYSAAEIMGHSVTVLMPPARKKDLPLILERLRRGERIKHFETNRLKKSGEQIDVSLTVSPIKNSSGTIIGASTIARDVTERKRAEERLKKSNEKLRALAARLQTVREEESIKIAREIHDEMGGGLTGLKIDVSWIERRLSEVDDEAVRQKLRSMSELIDETIQKVRNISTELRPSVLDDLGLAAAIEWQAREFQRRTEIECVITSLDEEVGLSAEKSTAVFRIFQELLTNVARHARATQVEISMEKPDGALVLKVCDDGRGIKESDITDTRSLGLLGMRERAVVFGGAVEIEGAKGRGTTATVRIPLE